MRKLPLAMAAIGAVAYLASTVTAQVLPNGVPTIYLERGAGSQTPMNIAYHPGFDYYYGSNGGNPGYPGWVWNSSGTRIQDLAAVNIDVRSWYYNPNTGQLEVLSYNAMGGGAQRGLIAPGVDGSGLLTGGTTTLMASVPGLISAQTMPAYDPNGDLFYSRDANNATVNVASRATGAFVSSFNLDLASAGVTGGDLTDYAMGYDPAFNLLIVTDDPNNRALVFDTNGAYIGASALNVDVPSNYRVGYANGQLFVFDTLRNGWQGYTILVPGPGAAALLGLAGLAGRRRRRTA